MRELDQLKRPPGRSITGLWPMLAYLKPYLLQIIGATVALIITAAVTLSMGRGLGYLIDSGLLDNSPEILTQGVFLFAALMLVLALATFVRFYLVSWIGERISADLRDQVFRHVIRLDPGFFEHHLASDLQSRITTDTSILQNVIGSSVSIAARSLIMFCGAVSLLIYTNPKLATVILISVPLMVFPVLFLGRWVRKLSRDSQEELAAVGGYVSEVIRNIKTVQANLHEQVDVKKFTWHVGIAFQVAVRRIRARALLIVLVIVLVLASITAMLWIGGQDILAGKTTLGELVAFIFYAFMMVISIGAISEVYSDLQRAAGATERLLELLAVRSDIQVPETPEILPEVYPHILTFDQVSHRYPGRPEVRVLHDISFRIDAGEYVALVGPSGGGKSTIFELILHFYDLESGSISFAGVDLRKLSLADLRAQIAIVPQDPALFRGTIRDNIAYSRPTASESEIQTAAATGHVLEFAERLPQGLDTQVGEGGVLLSGGQRQRIAVARAALKRPRLLLLDEATSSLDAESEFIVQRALEKLMARTTTLVIAHRLATVQNAKRILLMSRGKLLAEGTHGALIKRSPLYARFVELQFYTKITADEHAGTAEKTKMDVVAEIQASSGVT